MAFVASFKNPLEIGCVLPPVFDGTGGEDEANDEGKAGSYHSDRRAISWREQKRESRILDQFVATTGYSRWYARLVLRHEGRRLQTDKQTIVVVARKSRTRRKRARRYDEQVQTALVRLWRLMDYICGKRLQPQLAELIPVLERYNEFRCDRETRAKLLRISAASIDRLLQPERRKYELRGRSGTKPGTLLKKQIPIRTFAEWDEQRPGFVEIDLVAHDGGLAAGDYCQTLDLTDIATTWTETQAVRNKAQSWVFAALKEMRQKLPFSLLGIDSDNGSEFINKYLVEYCKAQKLSFTRSPLSQKRQLFCRAEELFHRAARGGLSAL
jgi:hypothetical protein